MTDITEVIEKLKAEREEIYKNHKKKNLFSLHSTDGDIYPMGIRRIETIIDELEKYLPKNDKFKFKLDCAVSDHELIGEIGLPYISSDPLKNNLLTLQINSLRDNEGMYFYTNKHKLAELIELLQEAHEQMED